MKTILSLHIPGTPKAKDRPRVLRTKSGASYAYNTKQTVLAEEALRQHLMVALRGWQAQPGKSYGLKAFFSFPAEGKGHSPGAPQTSKPDLDNLLKLVLDALKPWVDDAQVSRIEAQKLYGSDGKTELLLVEL